MSQKFDIRRQKQEVDTTLGGVTVTSTAIETRDMDLQNLSGEEILALGGLRIEAKWRGFMHVDSNIIEGDSITSDSGSTRYQVVAVDDWDEHIEVFVKKVE